MLTTRWSVLDAAYWMQGYNSLGTCGTPYSPGPAIPRGVVCAFSILRKPFALFPLARPTPECREIMQIASLKEHVTCRRTWVSGCLRLRFWAGQSFFANCFRKISC